MTCIDTFRYQTCWNPLFSIISPKESSLIASSNKSISSQTRQFSHGVLHFVFEHEIKQPSGNVQIFGRLTALTEWRILPPD